ncbi:MAG: hypothetical protein Ct9H300mP1_28750 [Planctomycetaceae bacterium]|nr:MAG: hypothetical protein Ct9H300mP1_28750 [Planctomycetaceae bacterium]
MPDAGRIKAFKVLSVAGSHWKGDASKAVDCSVSTARRGSARRSRRHISNGSRRRVAVITACWASSTGCSRSPRRSGRGCAVDAQGRQCEESAEDFIKAELLARATIRSTRRTSAVSSCTRPAGTFPITAIRICSAVHPRRRPVGRRLDPKARGRGAGRAGRAGVVCCRGRAGVRTSSYPVNGTRDERVAFLHHWERTQERFLLKPMNCPHHVRSTSPSLAATVNCLSAGRVWHRVPLRAIG